MAFLRCAIYSGLGITLLLLTFLQVTASESPLIEAIKSNKGTDTIKPLLEDSRAAAHINKKDEEGVSALLRAINAEQWDTARLLIDHGAKVLGPSADIPRGVRRPFDPSAFVTPLEKAIVMGNAPTDFVENMINHIHNVNKIRDAEGNDLTSTLMESNPSLIPHLLERGLDVTKSGFMKHTPITTAITLLSQEKINMDVLRAMLESHSRDKIRRSLNGEKNALVEAFKLKQWDAAVLLSEFGADLTAKKRHGHTTPFEMAIFYNTDAPVLEEMIQYQDPKKIKKYIQQHPKLLAEALHRSQWDTASLLINLGSNALEAVKGESILEIALSSQAPSEIFQNMLASQGNDATAKFLKKNPTVLGSALKYNRWDVAEMFVDFGADVTSKDALGNTPIHRAIEVGAPEDLVEKMLSSTDKVADVLNKGPNALTQALRAERWDLVQLLLQFGVDSKRIDGHTSAQEIARALAASGNLPDEVLAILGRVVTPGYSRQKSANKRKRV